MRAALLLLVHLGACSFESTEFVHPETNADSVSPVSPGGPAVAPEQPACALRGTGNSREAKPEQVGTAGFPGGAYKALTCPPGKLAVGLQTALSANPVGPGGSRAVAAMALICGQVVVEDGIAATQNIEITNAVAGTGALGYAPASPPTEGHCPDGQVLVGLEVSVVGLVKLFQNVKLNCKPATADGLRGAVTTVPVVGSGDRNCQGGGTNCVDRGVCGAEEVVDMLDVWTTSGVEHSSLYCRKVICAP